MSESFFPMDRHRRSDFTHRPHHTTPSQSPRLSFASPQTYPFPTSRRTSYKQPPSTPFASDNDRSWQAEISWQFEPTGWKDSRDGVLGAALSPWTGTPRAPSPVNTPGSRMFRQSAKDYYASGVSGGDLNFRNFTNPYYEYSNVLSPGRIELQSHEADHQPPQSTSFISGYMKSPTFARMGTNHLIDDIDDDLEDSMRIDKQDPRWFCVSRAYADDHNSPINGTSFRSHDQHDFIQGYDYDDIDFKTPRTPQYLQSYVQEGEDYYDEEEEKVAPQKTIGIFGLFKYSTKFDILLIIIGCLGALINGGSLPWYSYLFGDFVNKIALDNDKDQMIKDVKEVLLYYLIAVLYAFYSFAMNEIILVRLKSI